MNFDLYFFNLINGYAGKWKYLDFLAIFFAKYLGYLLIICLAIFALVFKNINIFLIPLLSGVVSRLIINQIIYFFYKRKRPSEILSIKTLIKKPNHPSFPSGHTSFFFAISFSVLFYDLTIGSIFLVLSFFIAFFRVFTGVHWPFDILAGIFAGLISSLIFFI
jgi:undecaprenyl-diphosphatase